LPGDQLFQLGGPTTVRGYPTDAVAGPDGYYAISNCIIRSPAQ
jgi:hemolysin activation/secretion protein